MTSLLIAHLKFNFREFAATLPHIAQNAFVQGVLGAVAATRSVAANGILAQNAAKCSLFFRQLTQPFCGGYPHALCRETLQDFFFVIPRPLYLKGLHLSLYPLSSGEGKNGKSRSRFSAMFWYRGTTRCSYLLSRSAIYQRRIKAQP